MKHTRQLLLLAIFLALSACSEKKHLWLSELQSAHQADNERVVRVYFDRYGAIYPSPAIYIDPRYFLPDKNPNGGRAASLESYFSGEPSRLATLCNYYQASGFDDAQDKILEAYRSQVSQARQKGNIKTLVVFIHGFNDPNPTGSYQELRNIIRQQGYDQDKQLLFLEIYWDGLTANGKNPAFSKIWGRAQLASRYVALGVRHFLNGLKCPLPEVMITHSLGAGVGTGALFNTMYKWHDNPRYSTGAEIARLSAEPAPVIPVRLGLLAPAIPGYATFVDFTNRSRPVDLQHDNISRVVLGINRQDYALAKGAFSKTQFLSGLFGATSLGANRKGTEVQAVKDVLRPTYGTLTDDLIVPVEFKTQPISKTLREHGLHFYCQDSANIQIFLAKLFN
jgi:hypothetical protein